MSHYLHLSEATSLLEGLTIKLHVKIKWTLIVTKKHVNLFTSTSHHFMYQVEKLENKHQKLFRETYNPGVTQLQARRPE